MVSLTCEVLLNTFTSTDLCGAVKKNICGYGEISIPGL